MSTIMHGNQICEENKGEAKRCQIQSEIIIRRAKDKIYTRKNVRGICSSLRHSSGQQKRNNEESVQIYMEEVKHGDQREQAYNILRKGLKK